MNHPLVKKLLPHIIAVIVFLIVSLLYCKPALDGKVLQQHDISNWKGANKQSEEYAKLHNGQYPLWTNSMFGGMPTFQIGGTGGSKIIGYAHQVLTLNLPEPVQFFFLASICFYILCLCLGISPWIGIVGGLAYAYATYNPIIITVGHLTKMWAIGYMPAVLGSIILILQKKYWLGTVLSALFISLLISVNHPQITYYLFIAIGIMCLFYAFHFVKNKDFAGLAISALLVGVVTILGVGSNAKILMSTYEYQKETQRGGASALTDTTKKEKSKTGLDKDYAFSYSMYKTEPLVLMFPRVYGGSSDKEEVSQDKSKAVEALSSMPKELQQQLGLSFYWGGIGGTSGPPYAGAIICFLAILGMFVVEGKYKWWILTAFILTLMMSWGSYFDGFNTFLYNNLPFYNKFRAPSMILVIPQLLLTTMAVLTLQKIISTEDKKTIQHQLKKGLIAVGVVFLFAFICYFTFDYESLNDKQMLKQVREMGQPQLLDSIKEFTKGLAEDRKSLFMQDIFRSLGFIFLAVGLIFASLKNWIKPIVVALGIALFAFIDVALVNKTYLNSELYQDKEETSKSLEANAKDLEILKDKSNFRVFNVNGGAFSEAATSYVFNSVGGYHSVKLRLYQDLIERQFSKQGMNEGILDMLNVKYLLQKDRQDKTVQYQPRTTALGNAWFVKTIQFVKDADAEMAALDKLNPRDTAVVQEAFKNSIPFTVEVDTTATIQLIKNDNDYIEYEASNTKNQFAVFSEIYYKSGWKAYVDGKEQPIVKTNYVLRGLALAPGKHKIEFKFKPEGFEKGTQYGNIATIILGLMLLSLIVYFYREFKKN